MHLFTEYALSTGSKIKTPKILEKFYPLPFDKYITLQVGGGMPAKSYAYFAEVIQLIKLFLDQEKIQIIQLGNKEEEQIPGVHRLCGETSLAQSSYIIKRGLLHFGTDSCLVHIASTYDKPIVSLYSISPPAVCGPYFGNKDKQICLEPEFPEGVKYSYNPNEPERYVNTIKPETIAKSILQLLGGNPDLVSIESIHIGKSYKVPVFELVPNCVPGPEVFSNGLCNIRADLYFNDQIIYQNISVRKCSIFTEQPLNIDILKQFKQNIEKIGIILNKDIDLYDFVKLVHTSSIPYNLLTYEAGDNLNELKLKYLDFIQILPMTKSKKDEIKNKDKINENSLFSTNKALLSDGKIYPSVAHWLENIPAAPINKIIDNKHFWEELEYFYIYSK